MLVLFDFFFFKTYEFVNLFYFHSTKFISSLHVQLHSSCNLLSIHKDKSNNQQNKQSRGYWTCIEWIFEKEKNKKKTEKENSSLEEHFIKPPCALVLSLQTGELAVLFHTLNNTKGNQKARKSERSPTPKIENVPFVVKSGPSHRRLILNFISLGGLFISSGMDRQVCSIVSFFICFFGIFFLFLFLIS